MTTSPLEREMRELNRRADVGARWSPKGIENVLKLLFHKRLNGKPFIFFYLWAFFPCPVFCWRQRIYLY